MRSSAEATMRMQERDKENEARLMELTTQPFRRSTILTKRRLKAKGLTMDQEAKTPAKILSVDHGVLNIYEDGRCISGSSMRELEVTRTYYRGGKKLARRKASEYNMAGFLQNTIDDENAICPNCGASGTIASFIDGCDSCGSQFDYSRYGWKLTNIAERKTKDVTTYLRIGLIAGYVLLIAIHTLTLGIDDSTTTNWVTLSKNSVYGMDMIHDIFDDFPLPGGMFDGVHCETSDRDLWERSYRYKMTMTEDMADSYIAEAENAGFTLYSRGDGYFAMYYTFSEDGPENGCVAVYVTYEDSVTRIHMYIPDEFSDECMYED